MKILIIGKGKMGLCLKEYFEKEYEVLNIESSNYQLVKKTYDYIIDFSHPDSLNYYKYLLNDKTKVIIGTTNFTQNQKDYILFLSKMNPIVLDANFSNGIDFLNRLLTVINETKYDVTINETHNITKLDSPSGTTKHFLEILNKKTPLVNSLRKGDVFGIHEIVLESEGETLVFKHIVENRNLFCNGVKRSMMFLKDKENGLYTFKDVIDCGN